jgi:hypothetical protein
MCEFVLLPDYVTGCEFNSLLLETAARMGAKRIFIDGISLLRAIPTGKAAPATLLQVAAQILLVAPRVRISPGPPTFAT